MSTSALRALASSSKTTQILNGRSLTCVVFLSGFFGLGRAPGCKSFIGYVFATSVPNSDASTNLLFINRPSKALQTKFPSKRRPAETLRLRARRRDFDTESKSSQSCEGYIPEGGEFNS